MTDTPMASAAPDGRHAPPDRAPVAYPGTPRWLKVSGAIALVLVLLFVTLHVIGLMGGLGGMSGMSGVHAPPAAPATQP